MPNVVIHKEGRTFEGEVKENSNLVVRAGIRQFPFPNLAYGCGMGKCGKCTSLILKGAEHLPAPLKLRGTQLRWFFKHALRDFLPPAVITKQKHGFGLPVGTWLIDYKPLLDLAWASIDGLRSRGIVQPRFIDELLDKRLREHATYFGNMVWVLMMLGLWLESRNL